MSSVHTDHTNHFITFKFFTTFLFSHTKRFDWPRRDDIDKVHATCVFYGPVWLQGNGPFENPNLEELETVFQAFKSRVVTKLLSLCCCSVDMRYVWLLYINMYNLTMLHDCVKVNIIVATNLKWKVLKLLWRTLFFWHLKHSTLKVVLIF